MCRKLVWGMVLMVSLFGAGCTKNVSRAATTTEYPGVPGVVVLHSAASTRQFVGSPGIAILPDGHYLAKCDLFGPGTTDTKSGTTPVLESADRGKTWTRLADVTDLYWATIFVHGKSVYMIGVTHEYGDITIRRSDDDGHTWTPPSILKTDGQFHCAPVPVMEYKGRLWRAFEQRNPTDGWANHFRAFVMSAPVGSDLLKAESWTSSMPLEQNAAWNGGDFGGWLEGNAVATPGGGVVDILRVAARKLPEKAAVVTLSADGKTASFDPAQGLIDFPGGATKFTIRYDPRSKLYWSLANAIPPVYEGGDPGSTRNTLALTSSPDLRTWTVRSYVISHPDPAKYGFQYVDWQFDGNDLIATSRTAYDDGLGGADNYHNANFLTFHRFANFRTLTLAASVPIPGLAVMRYEAPDLTVTGHGFEVVPLADGAKTFSNRGYVWAGLPAGLEANLFTQTAGGIAAKITVHAKRDTTVRFATIQPLTGAEASGWTKSLLMFHYTDGGKTVVTVYTRPLKAGETLTIPQSGWSGGIVLLKGN